MVVADFELNAEEQAIVDAVAEFVDKQVRPKVQAIEHANEYPTEFIEAIERPKQGGRLGRVWTVLERSHGVKRSVMRVVWESV